MEFAQSLHGAARAQRRLGSNSTPTPNSDLKPDPPPNPPRNPDPNSNPNPTPNPDRARRRLLEARAQPVAHQRNGPGGAARLRRADGRLPAPDTHGGHGAQQGLRCRPRPHGLCLPGGARDAANPNPNPNPETRNLNPNPNPNPNPNANLSTHPDLHPNLHHHTPNPPV